MFIFLPDSKILGSRTFSGHFPVHGTVHTVGFVQALERSSSTQEGDESQSHRTTGENAGVKRLGMRELWVELGRLSFGGF